MEGRVQIWIKDGGPDENGCYDWGWQCFGCGDEDEGFKNASTAQEAADNHDGLCKEPVSTGQVGR